MFVDAIAAGSVVLIATVIIRRTAHRVTLNPFYWFVTAMRNYWATVVLNYLYVLPTHPLVPVPIAHAIFYVAVAVILYSRISLGRNIGFLPARRELVTTGAYGIVRHPIHTGELLYFLSFILIGFSPVNWLLLFLGSGFVIWKSLMEENFLKEDADYREYCKKVPYRWIPGLI
jgi:protein-S-isoprenylcysteine O-methyltransferase Ste14